ncbi:y4mF family transcriptional regulator [Nocardioides albertanoniae]|uniref:Y4mF family transcriptional regulator n=1 Tax=Nocardioides albertanoniae TaxID=1175486 RepID=A0A543A2Z5_9ACTN|nr:helix-turn-helix transcriptional regulator [Nocardioides albertanoniae]TQL66965.1 y4mF family transcriptional regulator [Nocardioides albertanoniae]
MPSPYLTSPAAFGAAVRSARQRAGLTQGDLAQSAGVGRRFVVDVEAGHPRAELGKALALLEVLDVYLAPAQLTAIAPHLEDVDLDAVLAHCTG